MTIAASEPRRPGRPRDPHVDAAILQAAVDVLSCSGFGGFTVDAVAGKAGVGKATVYRRWTSREALVMDAAATLVKRPELPDTGTLRGDLVELYTAVFVDKSGDLQADNLMAAVIAEAAVNPEMKRVLAEFSRRRRDVSREILKRGMARGELAAEADTNFLSDVVAGTLLYRLVVTDEPVDAELVERLVDLALGAVGAS